MGKLGHSGFGLFCIEGRLLVVSPKETSLVPDSAGSNEIEGLFEQAEDKQVWMDHKINRSLNDYSEDF